MLFSEILFWFSLAVLFYCYIGYGLLLFLINGIKQTSRKRREEHEANLPAITLIIPAFNEAPILSEKIRNTVEIDYPAEKLHVIFITDGSTDGSADLLRGYPGILVLHQAERKGKTAAINRAMAFVKTPIVVFSDANSMLNRECMQKISAHYSVPGIGGVAGEKKILTGGSSAVGQAEGLYWKYESFMKRQDAALYTVVGAAGELFSIRRELFMPPADEVILDDFIISMSICLRGYRIAYEPGAFATELPSASLADEEKRKVRISAGAYQSVGLLGKALNPFRYPLLSFQYISRRVLRWIVCPVMLIVLLFSNIHIYYVSSGNIFFGWLLGAQAGFYLLAFAGWIMMRTGLKGGIATIPFYFLFMNYCLVRGFIRFTRNRQEVTWEKAIRE